jgi:hypothetical protein
MTIVVSSKHKSKRNCRCDVPQCTGLVFVRQLDDKLRQRDDDFRRQLETIEHGHRQTINQMQKNYEEKLQQSHIRVTEVEDEMRLLLIDTDQRKKKWEERVKHLTSFMNDLHEPM